MSEANTLQASLTNEVRADTLLRNVRLQTSKIKQLVVMVTQCRIAD